MRRLLPEPPADIDVPSLIADLEPWSDPPEDRPHVMTNFALTVDGRSTIGGVSRPIGSQRDTQMLVGLRTRADAVMVGGGTMRAERYGRVIADPAKRERRVQMGLSEDPLMVIVSGRLELPWDAPLFTEKGRILIFTSSGSEPPSTTAELEVICHDGVVDLQKALAYLRREQGVRSLLCEGGAHLHGELLRVNCVDELFVTHAPMVAGDVGPGLVSGLPPSNVPLKIEWLVTEPETGELFMRYSVVRP